MLSNLSTSLVSDMSTLLVILCFMLVFIIPLWWERAACQQSFNKQVYEQVYWYIFHFARSIRNQWNVSNQLSNKLPHSGSRLVLQQAQDV